MRTGLPADVHAPAAARRFVATTLGALVEDADPRTDDVTLVVSELVTNSVRAAATAIDVELAVSDERLVLHVTDDAPGWPASCDPAWDDQRGRGLAIVTDVADEWHTTTVASGKRVTAIWFRESAGQVG